MKVPQRDIGNWARELIDECEASRKQRISQYQSWRQYYFTGADDDQPSPYNKIKGHVDRLASYLYSPVDVRFAIDYDKTHSDDAKRMGEAAASVLSKDFHRRGADLAFGQAVKWGLIDGCRIVKQLWGRNGVDTFTIPAAGFAVYREDLPSLDHQEAFVHTTFLTPTAVDRLLVGNPRREEILREIHGQEKQGDETSEKDDYFKQLVIGGTNPVSLQATNNPAGGIVRWMEGPAPQLSAQVMAGLLRFDELWVIDDDRQDYTTIQLIGTTPVLGDMQHVNLCNIKEHHPFVKVCPNETEGYFWGRSEIADIFMLQDQIKKRCYGIERMMRLQENPPTMFSGTSGINDEVWAAQNIPGGFIAEENPNAKAQPIAPPMPDNIWVDLHELGNQFDDVTGTPPIMQGQGEPGVRAGVHADTLLRTGSPRIRDRALIVERQLEDCGDLFLRLMQAQDATAYRYKTKSSGLMSRLMGKDGEFLLSQLPDDFHVEVDSHSASPAFSEDERRLAFALAANHAISPIDLLRLTHPQHEDNLVAAAEQRQEAQEALIRQHPELLTKQGSHRR